MIRAWNRLTQNQLIQNLVAQVLQAVAGIALVREIIRVLGPTEYGLLSFALLVLSFSSVLDGLRNLLTKHIHDQADANSGQVPALLRSMERWNALVALISCLLVIVATSLVDQRMTWSHRIPLALAVAGMILQSPYCANLLSRGQTGLVALLKALYWLALYLSLWALATLHRPSSELILAILLLSLLLTIAYRTLGYGSFPLRGPVLSGGGAVFIRMIGQGLAFNALAAMLTFADRALLIKMGSPAAFGLYAVIYDLGSKGSWFGTLVAVTYFPKLSRLHSEHSYTEMKAVFWRAFVGVVILMGTGFTLAVIFSETILKLWAPNVLWTSREYLAFRFVAGAAALQGIGAVAGYGLIAFRDMRSVLKIYATSALVTLAISPWLVQHWGSAGAGATYLLSRIADVLMLIVLFRKHLSGPAPRQSESSSPEPHLP